MKAAIISLTEKGRELSAEVALNAKAFSSERFCFQKHSDSGSRCFVSLAGLVSDIFDEYDAMIFVCACVGSHPVADRKHNVWFSAPGRTRGCAPTNWFDSVPNV